MHKLNHESNLEFANLEQAIFISTQLRDGRTYKTTEKERHKLVDKRTIQLLQREFQNRKLIAADIGISYGNTTYELAQKMRSKFKVLYGIDKSYIYKLISKGKFKLLLDDQNKIKLGEFNGRLIRRRYMLIIKTFFWITPLIKTSFFKNKDFIFLDPRLLRLDFFEFINADILNIKIETMPRKLNFIRVMNLLNKVYFNEFEINKAIKNLNSILEEGGVLLVGKTVIGGKRDGMSDATFYKKIDNKLEKLEDFNHGSEIDNFIAQNL